MSTFRVDLRHVVDDSYDIETGFGLEDKLIQDISAGLLGGVRRLAVITDDTVKELYADRIAAKLNQAGFSASVFSFPPGEESKSREVKAQTEDAMLSQGYRRDCAVIAVGGGVVTDLAGFLAGTYGRGVPYVNYATTLLAAADASVGGKTAVDTDLATNLIGLFYQPEKVYIDVAAWRTLPENQIHSGLAETIKHGCLGSREFFEYLEEHMDEIMALDPDACSHIASENCRIKYQVVMQDERESGLRECLNLGHTVGRAIETESGYRLLHGEAVSIGLAAQTRLSRYLGYMTQEEQQRVISLLRRAGLPVEIPDYIDREALLRRLYTDKKVRDGRLRFVVQQGIGQVVEFSPGVYAVPVDEETARRVILLM